MFAFHSQAIHLPLAVAGDSVLSPPQPEECKAQHNRYGFTLSILVLIGIILSYLPQLHRIVHKGSSDGFSPWFLLLGCLSTCWSFFNIIILQWQGIRCCTHINVGLCVESTLGVAQLSVQFALFTSIFALYMIYFPPYKKVNAIVHNLHLVCLPSRSFSWAISIFFAKIIVGNIIVSTIITLILLALVDDDLERHSVWTLLWAGFLGISSVLLAIVQYIPQIVETYLRKSVGALSIPMMLMQAPAAILMTVSIAISPGSNWSTWLPYAFASLLQMILLGMCLCYYFRARKLGVSSFHVAETTPLLKVQSRSQMYDSEQEHGSVRPKHGPGGVSGGTSSAGTPPTLGGSHHHQRQSLH